MYIYIYGVGRASARRRENPAGLACRPDDDVEAATACDSDDAAATATATAATPAMGCCRFSHCPRFVATTL